MAFLPVYPAVGPRKPGGGPNEAPAKATLDQIEAAYRKPGRSTIARLFGVDPFDFWVGPFYIGTWTIVSMLGAMVGVFLYFTVMAYGEPAANIPPNLNIISAKIIEPPIENGLAIPGPGQRGFYWFWIVVAGTTAFLGWFMREIDISLKLRMGLHVPICYSLAVSAWITLQWLRPIWMGSWGHGFTIGIIPHLDWVSNVGYAYNNFYYNPFHALAVAGYYGTTMFLALHGAQILSAAYLGSDSVERVDQFWWDTLGYGAGELGIHTIGFYGAIVTVLLSNLCILFSGTLVFDWVEFWNFWPTGEF
jgi:hypothetical protein